MKHAKTVTPSKGHVNNPLFDEAAYLLGATQAAVTGAKKG